MHGASALPFFSLAGTERSGLRRFPRVVEGKQAAGLRSEISEFLVQAEVKAESTVLIAHAAEGPARRKMILHLDNLILGWGNVGGEGDEQVAGDPLLHGNVGAWILLRSVSRAAQYRVNGQARDSGDILYPAGKLAADAGGKHRLCPEISGRGIGAGGFGGLSEGRQVDDVSRRKRRVG